MSSYLYKLIQEGEHQRQDFKFCINDSRKIAKSLVAFANTNGGKLLVGVKDNGKIAGIRTDEEFYMVEAAAKIYSNPPINFSTQQWQIEGKTVLEIQIEPSTTKPHFAKNDDGKWLAYIRVHDENILAHKIQLNVWRKNKSQVGIYFTYSETEKILVEYLQKNPTITFSKFVRLAHISRNKAEEVLSNSVIMEIVEIKTEKDVTFFSLNTMFDESFPKEIENVKRLKV
ncbi:MAG: ATP-binding protein [Draconibacterium sp.]|nr:ATP-binding protein [Draconibacterium sp.]